MTIVDVLQERGALSALDVHLARTLSRLGAESREEVALAIALLSRHTAAGNVCIDLERPVVVDASGALLEPERVPPQWRSLLASSPLVDDGCGAPTPLVLNGSRLYLRRHWEDECALATDLRTRARAATALDPPSARAALDRLHPPGPPDGEPDWQRVAAYVALRRRLCVITGGPGTGKTTTVVTIAALAIEQAMAQRADAPRITLCAPTGKAAGRLTASVRAAAQRLPCSPAVRSAIPEEARTIHRLLGASTTRPGHFRHDARSPLRTDLLIVDEASMVDLALMTRLVAAVPPHAGLILLGDRDQLASVEAGAVLDDLCPPDRHAAYSPACAAEIRTATGVEVPAAAGGGGPPIRDCIVTLTRSHRFGADSDVGCLATAVRNGDADEAVALLTSAAHPALVHLERSRPDAPSGALRQALVTGYAPYLRATSPSARLAALGAFRVLCAHQQGPDGVHALNHTIERTLVGAGLLRASAPFYDGRPLLVTRNDYRVRLFNGDVGTVIQHGGDRSDRLAVFLAPDGTERRLSPGRLPPCETAFAVSIHKSQGSELDQVLIVLPEGVSPVLSRELLYTAVSRARASVTICASLNVVRAAVATPVRRTSGLRDRLLA